MNLFNHVMMEKIFDQGCALIEYNTAHTTF